MTNRIVAILGAAVIATILIEDAANGTAIIDALRHVVSAAR